MPGFIGLGGGGGPTPNGKCHFKFPFLFLNHSLIPSINDDINAKSECKCNGLELHYKPDRVTKPQSPKTRRRSRSKDREFGSHACAHANVAN